MRRSLLCTPFLGLSSSGHSFFVSNGHHHTCCTTRRGCATSRLQGDLGGAKKISVFSGFPRDLCTHRFSSAGNEAQLAHEAAGTSRSGGAAAAAPLNNINTNNNVFSDLEVDQAIRRALIDPKERIALCRKALKKVQNDPLYKDAQAWEAKALQKAERHPFHVLWGVFTALFAQNAILMYWVFVAFDWNLVEPCTYFFGYTSITWFALVFYKFTGLEFTYDAMIEEMRRRKLNKLSQANEAHVHALIDFRHKEEVLRAELAGLGVEELD